ncbi:hypothetical protein ABPG75_011502 [Micractinium tetrahymenae]
MRRPRRALREETAADPVDVQTLLFENTCEDTGVHFGLHFSFDPTLDWFGPEVTAAIPEPFVDWFYDNIGQVNFQMEDSRVNDPKVKAAIATGVCFNEEIWLRYPGWKGHGPQPTLGLDFPNSTVSDMWVNIHQEEQFKPVALAAYEASAWRTLDTVFDDCKAGSKGCAQWYKVSLDEPVEFVCAEDSA